MWRRHQGVQEVVGGACSSVPGFMAEKLPQTELAGVCKLFLRRFHVSARIRSAGVFVFGGRLHKCWAGMRR